MRQPGISGWRHGSAPSTARMPVQALQAVAGRGLQIVHELSRGRWGHHPTRARLGGWGVRGKAVWFAVPAPLAHARLVDVTGLHAYTLSADVSATSRASPEGDRERWGYADLVEAAEQTVRRYEELELGLDLAVAGA